LDDPARCTVEAFEKFKETRAAFSMEVGQGALPEAILDLRGCDYSNADLGGKIVNGAILTGANLDGANLIGAEIARVNGRSGSFRGTDFTDSNLYSTNFDGADMRGAVFENTILTAATFGQDETGTWANLEGTLFEGALISSSDQRRICENPTMQGDAALAIGCKRR